MKATTTKWHDWSKSTWRVKRTLDRNRALLKALRTQTRQAEESPNEWLSRRGFNFEFHTHVTTTHEGQLAVMCFDEGYILEDGNVVPYVSVPPLATTATGPTRSALA
jgi:hypothetical protein